MSRAGEVFLYFLRLGAVVFGGIGPQLAAMRRDLVERRGWVSEEEYRRGVALAYLCPGPVGTQAGVYFGWRRAGAAGATAALLGFLLVPFVLICALAAAAQAWGGLGGFAKALAGARCAVAPIVALSAWRLYGSALETKLDRTVALVAALWCLVRPGDAVAAVLCGGAAVALAARVPRGRLGAAEPTTLAALLLGVKAGLLVYGTGQAILPVVRQTAVLENAWITDAAFSDAVSAGLVTPGPIVLAVSFVGWSMAGFPGALAAAAGAFVPGWALVLLVGPWMPRVEKSPLLTGFARGATAAAIGGVAAAAAGLAATAVTGPASALLAAAAFAAVLRRAPDPLVVLAGALLGPLLL